MDQSAGAYHEKTCYERSKMGGYFLDWQNRPDVFKSYVGREFITMPREIPLPRENLFTLHERTPEARNCHDVLDLEKLSRILLLTYTVTSRARQPNGVFYFRSAASAGALYPTEIYVVSDGMKDVAPGLYHFSIARHSLVKLRDGHLSGTVEAFLKDRPTEASPLTIFLTAIFFRSAWKYRDRSYRYHLLDTGHVIENLALSLKAIGYPFEITFDFDDVAVNDLLGLDEAREVALSLCRVKGKLESHEPIRSLSIGVLSETVKGASRVSAREFDVSTVRVVHTAGYHIIPVKRGLNICNALGIIPASRVSVPLESKPEKTLLYPDAVFHRRSSRNFIAESMPVSHLRALLNILSSKNDGGKDSCAHSICTGVLTNGVESLNDGFYLMDEEKDGLGEIKPGAFTGPMSGVCLDQGWMSAASLHFVFMTHMRDLEQFRGARGYRYAMMIAGRMGERLYLGASALGLGCCGIGAFYDGEAAGLLGLNESSRVLYVVAVGILKSMLKRD